MEYPSRVCPKLGQKRRVAVFCPVEQREQPFRERESEGVAQNGQRDLSPLCSTLHLMPGPSCSLGPAAFLPVAPRDAWDVQANNGPQRCPCPSPQDLGIHLVSWQRPRPTDNQRGGWTSPCGSQYICKTPYSKNHQET